jgi:hypothetical protein
MRGKRVGAKALRAAAELMNDGGKHWTKGQWRRLGRKRSDGTRDVKYCDLGGLHAVIFGTEMQADPARFKRPAYCAAIMAQALVIEPGFERRALNTCKLYGYNEKQTKGYVLNCAEGVIMGFNDQDATRWDDVKGKLLAAADKLDAS